MEVLEKPCRRDGLELMKHEVETCAKQESLKKLERSMMDMQEENARL